MDTNRVLRVAGGGMAVVALIVSAASASHAPAGSSVGSGRPPSRTPSANAPAQIAAAPGHRAIRVMEWNACGAYAGCPHRADPIGRDRQIAALVEAQRIDVVFLPGTCERSVSNVLTALGPTWSSAFAPARAYLPGWSSPRGQACDASPTADEGLAGTAILARGELAAVTTYDLPSPSGPPSPSPSGAGAAEPVRALVCARDVGRGVRLCATAFSTSAADPDGAFRGAQAARTLAALDRAGAEGGDEPVVFGGTLNLAPPAGNPSLEFADPSPALGPTYDRFAECAQAYARAHWHTSRTGPGTSTAHHPAKLDYLFARHPASWHSCVVLDTPANSAYARHLPLVGVVAY